jgi:hypothetical protein
MKKILTLALSAGLFNLAFAQKITLVKWETDTLLQVPEAVIYDAVNKSIYAANINGEPWGKDGNGFIAKLSASGKVEQLKWVTGLDAPKGMGIYGGKLYVADITKLVIIDINSGKIEKAVEAADVKQLNDVTVDDKGRVYVSESGGKGVYLLENNKLVLWYENQELKKPNGLLALKTALRMVDAGNGGFYTINYTDKSLKNTAKGLFGGDGIVEIGADEYLVSNWNGEVNYVKGEKVEKILDTKQEKKNAADIWYIAEEKLVLVPTFFGNTVAAYQLNKN